MHLNVLGGCDITVKHFFSSNFMMGLNRKQIQSFFQKLETFSGVNSQ